MATPITTPGESLRSPRPASARGEAATRSVAVRGASLADVLPFSGGDAADCLEAETARDAR